jgi:hypothetical protein
VLIDSWIATDAETHLSRAVCSARSHTVDDDATI